MASSTAQTFPVFDADGAPLAGLSPTWTSYVEASTGEALSQPTISEIGGGWYRFAAPAADENACGIIDCGATANPRYLAYSSRYEDALSPVVSLTGQGTESVTLTATGDGRVLPGVRVTAYAAGVARAQGTTGPAGTVTLLLDPGTYTLRASLVGWQWSDAAATVSESDTVSPSTLAGTAVSAAGGTAKVGLARSLAVDAPTHDARIEGITSGDTETLTRIVSGLAATISAATLTVKRPADLARADDAAVVQLAGTVTDSGADGTGAVTFALTAALSSRLRGGERYVYDVQVVLTGGAVKTVESGSITARAQVTRSTS